MIAFHKRQNLSNNITLLPSTASFSQYCIKIQHKQVKRAMNISIIIFSVFVTAISVVLVLVQYYNIAPKTSVVVKYDPYFTKLIVTPKANDIINYEEKVVQDTKRVPSTQKTYLQSKDTEAKKCLMAALTSKSNGKLEKARKLFEHAVNIAPHNPDVLTKYGEFLENYRDNVISADEMYVKALTYCPNHDEALSNQKRTSQLVDHLDVIMLDLLDAKRDQLKASMDAILSYDAKKAAFYLHIYHTVGIEGNTMTISQLRYLLETRRAIGGISLMEHNEILGLETALRYVKTLTAAEFIHIEDILDIHKRVIGYVDPISSGQFRDEQVFVGSHVPPPPEDIKMLMEEFVAWLNSDEAMNMHPVRLAALAHYKLVDIHPFTDGNGRTSRLLMNLILLKFGYPPVIVYKEDRQKYYDTLTTANRGDVRPFVRFIAYCTDETLNTYLKYNKRLDIYKSSTLIETDGPRIVK